LLQAINLDPLGLQVDVPVLRDAEALVEVSLAHELQTPG
jgi:hypothetical protein